MVIAPNMLLSCANRTAVAALEARRMCAFGTFLRVIPVWKSDFSEFVLIFPHRPVSFGAYLPFIKEEMKISPDFIFYRRNSLYICTVY